MKTVLQEANRNFLRVMLAMAIATIGVVLFPRVGATEGTLFPVVTDFTFVSASLVPPDQTRYVFRYTKVRHCPLEDVEWYWVNDDFLVLVRVVSSSLTSKRPIVRPPGKYLDQAVVDVPWERHTSPMKIVMHHLCHGKFLWVTETTITVPGDQESSDHAS